MSKITQNPRVKLPVSELQSNTNQACIEHASYSISINSDTYSILACHQTCNTYMTTISKGKL